MAGGGRGGVITAATWEVSFQLLPRPGLLPPLWSWGEWVLGRSHGSCHLMPRENLAAVHGRGALSPSQPLCPICPQTPLHSRQSLRLCAEPL